VPDMDEFDLDEEFAAATAEPGRAAVDQDAPEPDAGD